MKIKVVPFQQPMGLFLVGVMNASDILKISIIDRRKYDSLTLDPSEGFQRDPSPKRISEISYYAGTVDATFPTPILLSLEGNTFKFEENEIEILKDGCAEIIDGQHRMLGLERSLARDQFELPVVFILDATAEQKALIFATINGKQTKVPASLVYDLFGVTTRRSPQKTAHEIVRALNKDPNSPWHRRLKMLGKKLVSGSNESLSQGTFVKFLLPKISDKPVEDMDLAKRGAELPPRTKCIFNEYFRKNQDELILKILINVFSAARRTWPEDWDDPTRSILSKTTGFTGIMKALPSMFAEGKMRGDLTAEFFAQVFSLAKENMAKEGIPLSSGHFSSSATGEAEFANILEMAVLSLPKKGA